MEELIIGYMQGSKYTPAIIHFYDPGSVTMPSWSVPDYYDMEICENGMIIVKSEGIISSNYIYETGNGKDPELVKKLYIDARNSENVLFYEEMEGNRNKMTQEAFEEFRKRCLGILRELE